MLLKPHQLIVYLASVSDGRLGKHVVKDVPSVCGYFVRVCSRSGNVQKSGNWGEFYTYSYINFVI